MTKKKFFVSLGVVMTALVGTAVCGAMLCMGNVSADAAVLMDKSDPVSAAVSLEAEPSVPWGDVEVHYDASSLRYISTNEMGEQVFLYPTCPDCGGYVGYPFSSASELEDMGTNFPDFVVCGEFDPDDCCYSYIHMTSDLDEGLDGTATKCFGYVDIHDGEEVVLTEPTCTTAGTSVIRCKDCGDQGETKSIPATGHDYGAGVSLPVSENFCSETQYTCKDCGSAYYSLGGSARQSHNYTVVERVEPTCVSEGSILERCTTCGWEKSTPISKSAHTAGNAVVVRQPTCTEMGESRISCTFCGTTIRTTPIAVLGHDYKIVSEQPASCTEGGHSSYSECSRCGDKLNYTEYQANGHDWSEYVDERESCTETGTRTRTCKVCGEEDVETTPAGTHTWNAGKVVKQATCTESGTKECECILCGEKQTVEIEPTGHLKVSVAAVSPTCTEPGMTAGAKCSVCGVVLEVQETLPAKGHDLGHVSAVEPTTTMEGNTEYWYCRSCGLYFSDKAGTHEIEPEDTVLEKLPDTGSPDDKPDDSGEKPGEEGEEEGGMSGWQIALAVIAGVVLLGVIGLLVDKFVINKNGDSLYDKAVSKMKDKSRKE